VPPILVVIFTIYVNAIYRGTSIFGLSSFNLLGLHVGWYGMGGLIALASGPVCYLMFRRVFGGPATPSSQAGDEELLLAAADAADGGAAAVADDGLTIER